MHCRSASIAFLDVSRDLELRKLHSTPISTVSFHVDVLHIAAEGYLWNRCTTVSYLIEARKRNTLFTLYYSA